MKKYIVEIEKALETLPKRTSKQIPESYIGGGQSQLKYIGLRVPDLQKTMKRGFSFSNFEPEKAAEIWDYVWWNSNCYEVTSLSLAWFYNLRQRRQLISHWPILKKWSLKIDNWAHSDTLSGIYARILEDNPNLIYPTLEKWNRSKNPWLRRLSIVSLIYYHSQREKVLPLSKILPMVDSQLEFDHYYVQKGVGWTLRETYNAYPNATFVYIKKNILKLSAHAFSAATEKIPSKQKNQLKEMRKQRR